MKVFALVITNEKFNNNMNLASLLLEELDYTTWFTYTTVSDSVLYYNKNESIKNPS